MSKWCGKIGYASDKEVETEPGIYESVITERLYYGDLVRNTNKRVQNSGYVNDNIIVDNVISILADPFAIENFYNIKYVEAFGNKWKISNVEVAFPRLVLTMGGLYNGEQA